MLFLTAFHYIRRTCVAGVEITYDHHCGGEIFRIFSAKKG